MRPAPSVSPAIGEIVKFIGVDGKGAFTRVAAYQPSEDGFGIDCVLELTSGPNKGHIGSVEWTKPKWNGKQWTADMREEVQVQNG